MKLLVSKDELKLNLSEGVYTFLRYKEKNAWHYINEFIDLNIFEEDNVYKANIHLVEDGETLREHFFPLEVEMIEG